MNNPVLAVIRERQSIRRFAPTPIPHSMLLELLEVADRAPSGFNLQPWHFILVTDADLRRLLCHVAMNQKQVEEAPATIVFVSNPRCWGKRYDRILRLSVDSGALDRDRAAMYRRSVSMMFRTGPLGLVGFLKRIGLPIVRVRQPVPNLITSAEEGADYVSRQTMLAVQNFILAAKSVGLDSVPMEGFDEYRIKKLLKIPHYMRVPALVAVGYALKGESIPRSIRLDLSEKVSLNQFPNRLLPQG